MQASQQYTGRNGEIYFEHRIMRRNVNAQFESARLFSCYIPPESVVIDFGCGTGEILNHLKCSRRLGVEINAPSIKAAEKQGIEIYRKIDEVPNFIADVAISHHALEHVENPFDILSKMSKKLKPHGTLVVVVPAENPFSMRNRKFDFSKLDKHLYCWSPLTIGNLVSLAGFQVIDCYSTNGGYSHYIEWSRRFPLLFELMKKVVAFVLQRYQIVCVAKCLENT